MKKLFFLLCLLPMLATFGRAQEMRQDVSLSLMDTIQPYVEGGAPNDVRAKATMGPGMLLSYRFQMTPNGAAEANYSYTRYTEKFTTSFASARVFTSVQEATVAYVRTIPFKKFNPFAEFGGGVLFFFPLGSIKTTTYDAQQVNTLVALAGGGIAYEISPSWDLRLAYRGYVSKPQNFGINIYSTGRWYIVSQPSIGFAYHF